MRRSKKRPPDLIRLQEDFRLHVVYAGDLEGPPEPCWFAPFDARPCEGRIEACHFINRQRIKNALWAAMREVRFQAIGRFEGERVLDEPAFPADVAAWRDELIDLACWDPRLAVPGCTAHHRPFDSHATPRLLIFRGEVPVPVEEAVRDWGLETALEDRCPFFDASESSHASRRVSDKPADRLGREAVASERELFLD